MSLEQPLVGALVARLDNPTVQLAALGSVAFPLAWLLQSPITMLLAASTALSKNRQSYRLIYRFMLVSSLVLTALQALLAFTPLFDVVIVALFQPPPEVIAPARLGLQILLPCLVCIAYRRFHQGLLIRSRRTLSISVGTALRFVTILLTCGVGVLLGLPGVVVGCLGVTVGVFVEAVFIGWRVRPIVRANLLNTGERLTWGKFASFYTPLAMTSLLLLMAQPLGSAALSRMPLALASLAAWPLLSGFIFMFRGMGAAYNEVVIAALETPGAWRNLRRFAVLLSVAMTLPLLLVALTPLAQGYFGTVLGLEPPLAALARSGLLFGVVWPTLTVFQSYYQGLLTHSGRTRTITHSVLVSLAVTMLLLGGGTLLGTIPGLFVVTAAFVIGSAVQVAWLAWAAQPVVRELKGLEDTSLSKK